MLELAKQNQIFLNHLLDRNPALSALKLKAVMISVVRMLPIDMFLEKKLLTIGLKVKIEFFCILSFFHLILG